MHAKRVFLTIQGSTTSSFGFSLFCTWRQQIWSSEEIRRPSIAKKTFTAEQDHGRTDAPGRKVRFTNVEDTQEVVVAARFYSSKFDQLCFVEFGHAHETQ